MREYIRAVVVGLVVGFGVLGLCWAFDWPSVPQSVSEGSVRVREETEIKYTIDGKEVSPEEFSRRFREQFGDNFSDLGRLPDEKDD